MAVTWKWADKIGEITTIDGHKITLYGGGNVDATCLFEYKYNKNVADYTDDKKNTYFFWSFWQDKKHLQACLKDRVYCKVKKIKLNIAYDKYNHITDSARLFATYGIKTELYYKEIKAK